MRKAFAWLFGIISFLMIGVALNKIESKLGLVTYITYEEPITVLRGDGRYEEYYEEEVTGTVTDLAAFNTFLSLMLCWRIYHWVLSGKPSGNLPESKRDAWFYWILGSIAYMAVSHFFEINILAPWS